MGKSNAFKEMWSNFTPEERAAKIESLKQSRKPTPTVLMENFEHDNESFERLYYDKETGIAVFRRTNTKLNKLIAYEVVTGKGDNLTYPRDEDFGKLGYCYSGTDEHCKKMIKQFHGIVL